jgi:phosphate-selective porin
LRRFKLMVGGNFSPKVQWYAQGLFKDGNRSPTDGRVYFQEAWLRFAFRKEIQVAIGQFKPPFGRERFTPDFQILTIDRSVVTDALTPAGPYVDSFYRDRGVQFDGELRRSWRYAVGVFDGRGANHQFHGIGPLVAGQAAKEVLKQRPVLDRPLTVQFGGAAAFRWGRDLPFRPCCTGSGADGFEHFRGADQRWGLELSADWGDASLRAEYIRARLDFAAPGIADVFASGWYLQGAKYLRPKWQAVLKLERLDPNEGVRNARDVFQTTFGLNYYFRRNRAKIMAAYVSRRESATPAPDNLVQVQLQYFLH